MVTVELQSAPDPLDPADRLVAEWSELAARTQAIPFLRPEWIGAWWRAFGTGVPLLLVLHRRRRLCGVAPLLRCGSVLHGACNWHTPEFGLLAETPADRHRLSAALFERRPRRVSLGFLSAEEDLESLRAAATSAGYAVLVRTLADSPWIDLQEGLRSYEAGLGRNGPRNVRRGLRRLRALGRVSLDIEEGAERLPELLMDAFRLEALAWKGERGTAIASRPETRLFYREVAAWAAAEGMLRLALLRLDGRMIAFQLGIEDRGVHYALKGGYDPEFAHGSPGSLVLRATIVDAFGRRLERYELLAGSEPYKLQWTNRARQLRLLQAFARTMLGRLDRGAYAYGRPLARAAGLHRALGRVAR
jgi:CelD/BcsL family acetyltransferase involved in cellulose biosynthesis